MNDCDKSPATISPAGAGIGGGVVSNTSFLEGSEINGAVEEILEAATRVDLAVAY